ncbi:hypothetical protein MTR_6g052880 [Medicago truncatula]|uniref:Uncharacterized protein n=1 Tax=Medicago truncatula TaxID=3880 RepID=A0A072UBC8_MEDTR|nr:hypothetical protein MTR_6g052880 [Medicago truncatula]
MGDLLVGTFIFSGQQPPEKGGERSSCILSSIKLGLRQNSYCRDFDLHRKHDLHVIYLREGGGLPLLKCVLKHEIRANRMVAPRASLSLTAMMPQHVRFLSGVSSFSSSASDTRNSKLEEISWLMCSTGLLMHDLFIDFDKLYMTGDSMSRDKTGKMGGGLTSQYKHSANFLGDDTIVNKSSH